MFAKIQKYVYNNCSLCINGAEKIDRLHKQFSDYHRELSLQLEQHKAADRNRALHNQLHLAKALNYSDRFCTDVFAGNDFGTLCNQYTIKWK